MTLRFSRKQYLYLNKICFNMETTAGIDKLALLEKAVQTIIHSQDEGLLAEIKAVLEEEGNDQIWNSLSQSQQQSVLEAEAQADEEEGGLAHEEAMKRLHDQRMNKRKSV
jgi:hypothetical protein